MAILPRFDGTIRCSLPSPIHFALLRHFERRFGADYVLEQKMTAALQNGLASIEATPPRPSIYQVMKDQYASESENEFSIPVNAALKKRISRLVNKTTVKTKKRNAIECLLQYMHDQQVLSLNNSTIALN
jgi:hypothetical protein